MESFCYQHLSALLQCFEGAVTRCLIPRSLSLKTWSRSQDRGRLGSRKARITNTSFAWRPLYDENEAEIELRGIPYTPLKDRRRGRRIWPQESLEDET